MNFNLPKSACWDQIFGHTPSCHTGTPDSNFRGYNNPGDLAAGESKAIGLRTAQCVEQDVQVANHRENESVMNTDMVGNDALKDRQDRAANDSHIQKARAIST